MYRIVLSWERVPTHIGGQAALDIEAEFVRNRPWHKNLSCQWEEESNSVLVRADNDFDGDGRAFIDELSDVIAANIKDAGDSSIRVVSITRLDS